MKYSCKGRVSSLHCGCNKIPQGKQLNKVRIILAHHGHGFRVKVEGAESSWFYYVHSQKKRRMNASGLFVFFIVHSPQSQTKEWFWPQ